MLIDFRERGRKRKRDRGRRGDIDWLPLVHAQTQGQNLQPRHVP